ncbi:glycosyltransferase family 2 protein [Sinomonas sp. P10A9]|uniref:Glycosyltransferase family 2 protein n=1 Tax=Sinomonas puerhi TaxID=3238584 RepID=A0AB39L0L4_9MICC
MRTVATPEITVVIPVRNGEATLREQLLALASQTDAPAFEIVVSDNGSTDGTAEICTSLGNQIPSLRVVDSGDRPGVAHARNEGVRAAAAPYVVFCDADDRVTPGWLRSLGDALRRYDAVGGMVVVDVADASAELGDMAPNAEGLGSVFGHLPYAVGANLGVRRDVYLALGGMDESFPHGHEEVDFAWRLQNAGYTLGWAPDARVLYRQRTTRRGAFRQARNYGESSIQLWTRHSQSLPLGAVSLRISVRNLGRELLGLPRLASQRSGLGTARALGWTAGVLAGHLRYRKFGSSPAPRLMESPQ